MSLGISEKEFKGLTPYQLFLRKKAKEMAIKSEKQIELTLLNTVRGFMGVKESITMNDFLGIKAVRFKTLQDFKYNKVKFDKYLQNLREEGKIKWQKM